MILECFECAKLPRCYKKPIPVPCGDFSREYENPIHLTTPEEVETHKFGIPTEEERQKFNRIANRS